MPLSLSTVWLIDDDDDEHFLLKRAFVRSGVCACPTSFTSPEKALQAFAALTPQDVLPELLVVDMNMPGLNGFAFLQALALKAQAADRPMPPSILLTSALPYNAQSEAQGIPSLLALQEKPLTAALISEVLARMPNP